MREKNFSILFKLFSICLFIGAGYAYWNYRDKNSDNEKTKETLDRFFKVKRGSFTISLKLDGTLDAIKHHKIKCQARGKYSLEILEIVEDKSNVKKEEVIVRFANDKYEDNLEKLEVSLEEEYKNIKLVQEDLIVTHTDNLNNIKFASDVKRSTEEAFKRYSEQDAPRKKKTLINAVATAENTIRTTKKQISQISKDLSIARMNDQAKTDKLEKLLITNKENLKKAKNTHKTALYNLKIFKTYENPQKKRTLSEQLTKAKMSLRQDIITAASKITKIEKTIKSYRTKIEKIKSDIKRMKKDIKMLTIKSPVDGIISLGAPRRNYYGGDTKEIKVGISVRPKEIIATIPDLSRFMVKLDVPEEFRSRIKTDLDTKLKSKAIPDLMLPGKITKISLMANHVRYWDKTSPKIYPTVISTDSTDPRLMPGMTMQVEIIVEEARNVLYIPVEAAYSREGETFCKVKDVAGLKEVAITTGRISNDFVEVISGISEQDEVFLHEEF